MIAEKMADLLGVTPEEVRLALAEVGLSNTADLLDLEQKGLDIITELYNIPGQQESGDD